MKIIGFQAKFIEVINDMPTGREFPLKDTILENKEEDGAFFAPSIKPITLLQKAK